MVARVLLMVAKVSGLLLGVVGCGVFWVVANISRLLGGC